MNYENQMNLIFIQFAELSKLICFQYINIPIEHSEYNMRLLAPGTSAQISFDLILMQYT